MVTNSIANRTIRQAIVRAFEDRGYLRVDSGATLGVAFYATARAKLDVTVWDYGYPFRPGWPNVSPIERVNPYDEGTVIVDVIRPDSRELFWRGAGKANLSADAARNVTELANTATAIVARFPRAPASVIAGRAR